MDSLQHWHPCDEFFKPLQEICEEFCAGNVPTPRQASALFLFEKSDPYLAGAMWLELNITPEYATRFCQRVDDCVKAVENWRCSYNRIYFCEKTGEPKWSDTKITLPEWFPKSDGDLEAVRVEVADLMTFIIWLSNAIRQRVHFEALEFDAPFFPTEIQREMLAALNRKSMTQSKMMTELNIGSKETFNGKCGKGGMKELIELKLVLNDKRKGGYYRPDFLPPT